ncbi:MAG: hypothetical protein MJE77_23825 [Proteobacteria bacterium]|nr:hypothetical protein [Pseudomonadota bacterium]
MWLLAVLVGVLVFASAGSRAHAQSRDDKRLVILPFYGSSGARNDAVRDGVIKALRESARIMSSRRFARAYADASGMEYGALAFNEDDLDSRLVARAAKKQRLIAVITGQLRRRRGRYRLRMTMRSAADGRVIKELRIRIGRRPRLSTRTRRLIRQQFVPVIDVLVRLSGPPEAEETPSTQPAPSPIDDATTDTTDTTPTPPPDPGGDDDPGSSDSVDDGPELPPGLGGDSEEPDGDDPGLPPGLGGDDSGESSDGGDSDLPILGDGGDTDDSFDFGDQEGLLDSLGLAGFVDLRNGARTQDDPNQDRRATLGELRLQLGVEREFFDRFTLKLTGDLLIDLVDDNTDVDLERGTGIVDLRDANLSYTPLDFLDIKVGRQTLTWGLGDFVFLNDLFPKDYQAYFTGRDNRYLKAPSDAMKASVFSFLGTLDIVFVPRFDPDRFVTGDRLSFFNGFTGSLAGQDANLDYQFPDEWFSDIELHARLAKTIGSLELAAYGYYGFWKSPAGSEQDPDSSEVNPTFPELAVYGVSLRDELASGIAGLEVAYYDSPEDPFGTNPAIANSEARFLIAYERQLPKIARDLTVSGQYYLEWMIYHDEYISTLPMASVPRDQFRHIVTLRITKLLFSQNLTASFLTVYSPSDADIYLRPTFDYAIADCCNLMAGGNFFFGADDHTMLNQFQNNNNVYGALRYGF